MKTLYKKLRLILGDQLNASHSWFKIKDDQTLYVIAELHQETGYVKHHIQKICAFFCAMEQFATALQQAGHRVQYMTLDDTYAFKTLADLINDLINQYGIDVFEYQLPDEYRLRKQLAKFSEQTAAQVTSYESEHFYLDEQALSKEFQKGKRHRMEAFYRKMRKRFNILMQGVEPLGGKWNFDHDNRNKLTHSDFNEIPNPLLFDNDVAHILKRLNKHDVQTIGTSNQVSYWPANRAQAKALLAYFCENCLPHFGRFQDAMTCELDNVFESRQWSLFHSRLSFAINVKMLSPMFVVNYAIDHYMQNKNRISVSQIEGFVRQIIGWREFIRGIYWANMPHYAQQNFLKADKSLPTWFWNSKTKMNCMRRAIEQSLDYAYAHHIQRLMITGNFCLITGINPNEVDEWYLGIYIDAIEWVEMPNTRGMSQFADGGIVGSKAYAASGNYVKKMSDYCSACEYQVDKASGAQACPLNSLYWRFMVQHEEAFSKNPRNRMVYANWQKKSSEVKKSILAHAEYCIENINKL